MNDCTLCKLMKHSNGVEEVMAFLDLIDQGALRKSARRRASMWNVGGNGPIELFPVHPDLSMENVIVYIK